MPSMPWIKLYTEMLDDPKLGRLSDSAKWRFVQFLLLAGECDAEGYLVNGTEPLSVDELAWRLRVDYGELDADMVELTAASILVFEDDAWCVANFSKRQGRSQSEKRAQWRERKQRQRDHEQDATVTPDGTGEGVTRDTTVNHAGVTPLDLELEKSREEEIQESGEDAGPDGPSTFADWQSLLEPESGKRPAILRSMHESLYPGHDPPDFGYIGKCWPQGRRCRPPR